MWGKFGVLVFVSLLLWPNLAGAQTHEQVSWLEGCWRGYDNGAIITEVWEQPPVPALLGLSFTRRGGETESWRRMRIEEVRGDLSLIYMPSEGRQLTYPFLQLTVPQNDLAPGRIMFEVDRPVFPKRIIYARHGDELTLTLSNGRRREEIYRFTRIDCAEAAPP